MFYLCEIIAHYIVVLSFLICIVVLFFFMLLLFFVFFSSHDLQVVTSLMFIVILAHRILPIPLHSHSCSTCCTPAPICLIVLLCFSSCFYFHLPTQAIILLCITLRYFSDLLPLLLRSYSFHHDSYSCSLCRMSYSNI